MNVVFAGTPAFAAVALQALVNSAHRIALVLTQPDRPGGRGLKPQPSAIKTFALQHHLAIAQPPSLRDSALQERLRNLDVDALIVAAYGLIVPKTMLAIPRFGGINIHASLLPRWRGAAPIQRALLAGDRETGITLMQMDEGLDTGAVLLQQKISIDRDATSGTLHDCLAALGARLLVTALDALPSPRPQDSTGVTYADKIRKEETLLDWARPAAELARRIRAFNPSPGAKTLLSGIHLKVWRAHCVAGAGAPGTVLAIDRGALIVACGEGALAIQELQKEGGKKLFTEAFLAGFEVTPGTRLGS